MATRVIERVDAFYEVQDVEFGKVYRWCPERVVVECRCGQGLSLTASTTSCLGCGRDHAMAFEEASTDGRQNSDEALHPWRYSGDRQEETEESGLPY